MPLNAGSVTGAGVGSGLAKEMFDDYSAKFTFGTPPGSEVGKQQIADMCNSFAQTVIAHFIANAEIATTTSSTVTVTSVAGVTTGAGVSGPGAGTSTGTGSGTIS